MDAEYIEALVAEFGEWSRRSIDKALNHTAMGKAMDQRRYVRNWVEDDDEKRKAGPVVPLGGAGSHRANGVSGQAAAARAWGEQVRAATS